MLACARFDCGAIDVDGNLKCSWIPKCGLIRPVMAPIPLFYPQSKVPSTLKWNFNKICWKYKSGICEVQNCNVLSKSYHCCPRESWANFDGLIFFTHLIFSCAARIYFQSWICKVCRMCLHLINFDKLIYFPFMFILRCPHVLLRENIWDFVIASLNQNMWKGVQGSVSKNISFSAKEILNWARTPPFG